MKNDDTGIRRGNKVKLFTDQGWRKGRILWGSPSILLEWKRKGLGLIAGGGGSVAK